MKNYFTAFTSAISNDVVEGLSLLGLPPLTDGAILLGSANVAQQGAPPRVVFEPVSMRFGIADRSAVDPAALRDALAERSLLTCYVTMRIHCWGIADPTPGSAQIPSADIDATDALVRQVVRSICRVAPGITMFSGGMFANSQRATDALLAVTGWYAQLAIEFATPITDYPLDYPSDANTPPGAPIGVEIATYLKPSSGGPNENGPVISIP